MSSLISSNCLGNVTSLNGGCHNISPCQGLGPCATFDINGNMYAGSGILPVAPPYLANRIACSWNVLVSGVVRNDSHCPTCLYCEDVNTNHTIYYQGSGNSTTNGLYVGINANNDFYARISLYDGLFSGIKVIGPASGTYNCNTMQFNLDKFYFNGDGCDTTTSGVVTVTPNSGTYPNPSVTSISTRKINVTDNWCYYPCYSTYIPSTYSQLGNCLSVVHAGSTSGYLSYINKCGVTINQGCGDFLTTQLNNLTLNNVYSIDDSVPDSGLKINQCKTCNTLNGTWNLLYNDLDKILPLCCHCSTQSPNTCINSIDIDLNHPSSTITFKSIYDEPLARLKAATPKGICPSSPVAFIFDQHFSNSVLSNVYDNRCIFSGATASLDFNLIPNPERHTKPCSANFPPEYDDADDYGLGSTYSNIIRYSAVLTIVDWTPLVATPINPKPPTGTFILSAYVENNGYPTVCHNGTTPLDCGSTFPALYYANYTLTRDATGLRQPTSVGEFLIAGLSIRTLESSGPRTATLSAGTTVLYCDGNIYSLTGSDSSFAGSEWALTDGTLEIFS